VLKIVKEPISLETPTGDEEESSLGDFVEDELAPIGITLSIKACRLSKPNPRVRRRKASSGRLAAMRMSSRRVAPRRPA
jgi:hypothetical protein